MLAESWSLISVVHLCMACIAAYTKAGEQLWSRVDVTIVPVPHFGSILELRQDGDGHMPGKGSLRLTSTTVTKVAPQQQQCRIVS